MRFLCFLVLFFVGRSVSECDSLSCLIAAVKMCIIVIVSGSVLKEDYWFLVKHLGISLITLHVFEKCDVIFDLALRFCNVLRLSNVR